MPDEPKPKVSGVKLGERLAQLKRLAREERKARKAAEAERDELKSKPTADDVVKERDALKAQIRAERHRKAFDQLAAKAKVRPEALDDLWELSKLDTSSDEPDPKAIESAIGEKVKARPYLIDAAGTSPSTNSTTTPQAPLNPGPGSGRGERVQAGGLTVKRKDLSNAEYMRQNQHLIGKAYEEQNLTIID